MHILCTYGTTHIYRIYRHICLHASAENRVLYPLFRDKLENGAIIFERAFTDDHSSKYYLSLLSRMTYERDRVLMDRTVAKFCCIEGEHSMQEEEWLDQLDQKITHEQSDKHLQSFIAYQKQAPTWPHPDTGGTHEYAAKLSHPLAALLDWAYDHIQGRPGVELEKQQKASAEHSDVNKDLIHA